MLFCFLVVSPAVARYVMLDFIAFHRNPPNANYRHRLYRATGGTCVSFTLSPISSGLRSAKLSNLEGLEKQKVQLHMGVP